MASVPVAERVNLSLLDRRLTPDLYTLIIAAQQTAGDDFALALAETARDYPHARLDEDGSGELGEPGVVRIGNLKRFTVPLRNLTVHRMESVARIGHRAFRVPGIAGGHAHPHGADVDAQGAAGVLPGGAATHLVAAVWGTKFSSISMRELKNGR